jgi:hypothetical protein
MKADGLIAAIGAPEALFPRSIRLRTIDSGYDEIVPQERKLI